MYITNTQKLKPICTVDIYHGGISFNIDLFKFMKPVPLFKIPLCKTCIPYVIHFIIRVHTKIRVNKIITKNDQNLLSLGLF